MGASLSLTVKESNVNVANNTSKVTATLKITATGSTWNGYSRSGYITIDGTKYSFSSSFGKGKTTTLATKSKTVTHNSDGSKSVTVKGYYSTGVSPGNLSKTKTITLTKINRNHTVSYSLNGGSGSFPSQTKVYGSALVLNANTPTRTGYDFLYWVGNGVKYYPSGRYTADANVTMVANWSEKTWEFKYIDGTKEYTETASYTKEYKALKLVKTGYTLGWSSEPGGSVIFTPDEVIKSATDLLPDDTPTTLYAVWIANTYSVSFNANGGTGASPPTVNVKYDSNFTFPTSQLSRDGYKYRGWSTSPTSTTFTPDGTTIKWTTDSDVVYYAIWEEIKIPINFYKASNSNDFSDSDNYNLLDIFSVLESGSYTIPNDITVEDLSSYTFSGYWTLNKPNQLIKTEQGIVFPAGVVPYNYKPTTADNFVTAGYTITNIYNAVNIYPVYKDNTPTYITKNSVREDYIPYNVTINDYYLYITNQTDRLTTSIYNDNVIICAIFKTKVGASDVTIDMSNSDYYLKSVNTEEIYDIELATPVINHIYDANSGITTYYMLFRTSGRNPGGVLIDPDTTSYLLSVSGLKDSFGKAIEAFTTSAVPPKIVRDINKNGTAIAFFGQAPDYTTEEKLTTHIQDELWNNGLFISNDYIVSNEEFEAGKKFKELLLNYIPEADLNSLLTLEDKSNEKCLDLLKLFLYILDKINT